jgi:alkanesulfonate monooxygenase SsuD/methylene tetrahydromethanopterin reductase-like flavin-dependent oxidoreductase (luciferase family)
VTRSSGAGVRLGVIFPQAEIGDNPADVRRYCRGVEDLGYDRLTLYDHVLGVDRYLHPEFTGPYDIDAAFHEPLVLLGYAAAARGSPSPAQCAS